MNTRTIENNAKDLSDSLKKIEECLNTLKTERAKSTALVKILENQTGILKTRLNDVLEKKDALNEKEYVLYLVKLHNFLEQVDKEEKTEEPKTLFHTTINTLVYLKNMLNETGVDTDAHTLNEILETTFKCREKLMSIDDVINDYGMVHSAKHKVRHPSADSSDMTCTSDEEDEKEKNNNVINLSNTPVTLFGGSQASEENGAAPVMARSTEM